VPFLFGLLIVPIGIWLRITLEETPEFVAQSAAEHRAPVFSTLRLQTGSIIRGFGLSILWGVCTYSLVIFMPVHAQKALGFTSDEAFTASVVGNLVLIGVNFLSGHLSDKIGRLKLLAGAAFWLLVLPPLLMAWLVADHSLATLIIVQVGFCALAGLYAGAMPATLAELFPTHVRSTGISIAYNAAFTLFAGFAPIIITWLAAGGIGAQAPTVYVVAAAIVALATIWSFPRRRAI
jgi:MHS family proline/betaine transporter-like MFS transporter